MTEDEARRLVGQVFQSLNVTGEWTLRAVPAGWLVMRDLKGYAGGSLFFVDAANGSLLEFPSSVPPGRLERDYERVRNKGRPVQVSPGP